VSWPRVGVGCVIRRDSELLLVRRQGSHGDGTWSTPGASLDFGEEPAECAVREVAEETGVEVSAPRFVGVTNDLFADDEKHYVTLWFEAEYAGGEPRALASDEVSEVAWFQEDRLPEPLFLSLESLFAGRTLP
jgi:8-oxo-dGTP diphosphatase